jgi:hypothetical protein
MVQISPVRRKFQGGENFSSAGDDINGRRKTEPERGWLDRPHRLKSN